MSSLDYKSAFEFLYSQVEELLEGDQKKMIEDILNRDHIMYKISESRERLKREYGFGVKDS